MAYFVAKGKVDRVIDAINRKKTLFFPIVNLRVDATCTYKGLRANGIDCYEMINVSILSIFCLYKTYIIVSSYC